MSKNLKQNHEIEVEFINYPENNNLNNIFDRIDKTTVETSIITEDLTRDNLKVNIYLESDISDKLLLRKIVKCKTFTDVDKFLDSSVSQGYLSVSSVIISLEDLEEWLCRFPGEVENMKKYFKEKDMLSSADVSEGLLRIRDYINSERYSSHISLIQNLITKYKEMI